VAITLRVMSAHHAERDGYIETDPQPKTHFYLCVSVQDGD